MRGACVLSRISAEIIWPGRVGPHSGTASAAAGAATHLHTTLALWRAIGCAVVLGSCSGRARPDIGCCAEKRLHLKSPSHSLNPQSSDRSLCRPPRKSQQLSATMPRGRGKAKKGGESGRTVCRLAACQSHFFALCNGKEFVLPPGVDGHRRF